MAAPPLPLLGLLPVLVLAGPLAAGPSDDAEEPAELRTIQGHVLCLGPDLVPLAEGADDRCNEPPARFALETASGERIHFLPEDPQAAMFLDPVVRSRELVVEGWPRPHGSFEILSLFSLKDGHLHDIYFRCDTCNITAKGPGPCWCCRQPFELRETAVE